MTGTKFGVVHKSSIKMTAIVGTVRTTEMTGAKKARSPFHRCAQTAMTMPSAVDARNAQSVRRKVFPKARQKDASVRMRPISANASQNEGST